LRCQENRRCAPCDVFFPLSLPLWSLDKMKTSAMVIVSVEDMLDSQWKGGERDEKGAIGKSPCRRGCFMGPSEKSRKR
jgi:hypothetical protein